MAIRKIQTTNNIHRWLRVIQTLKPQVYCFHPSSSAAKAVEAFYELTGHLLKHKGEKRTIFLLKEYRNFLRQWALEQAPVPLSWHSAKKNGFPRVLQPWEKLANGTADDRRVLLSIWRMIDEFRCEPELDLSTVTEKGSSDKTLIREINNFIDKWFALSNFTESKVEGSLILSNNAGPNGPALAAAQYDAEALAGRDEELAVAAIVLLCDHSISQLRDMHAYLGFPDGDPQTKWIHSKIIALADKACKTRVVAIGDWWSNCALSFIHNTFMLGLSKFASDLTFRQSQLPKVIKTLGSDLYTSDLTAFTDRFPREIQVKLVEKVFGKEVGELWLHVLTGRTFETRKGPVKYAVGTPMGFLSSWAVATAAHHAVKHFCAYKLGIKGYKYLLLGDDNLDTDFKVHELYNEVLSRLGVTISKSKCTSSKTACAEFAKREFWRGTEITGLPVSLFVNLLARPEQFIELVRILREREYSELLIATGVQSLVNKLKPKPRRLTLLALLAPTQVSGNAPLLGLKPYNETDKSVWDVDATIIEAALIKARAKIFWEQVDKLSVSIQKGTATVPPQGVRFPVPVPHIAYTVLDNKLRKYVCDDEYTVWDSWMKGENYDLAFVPNMNSYQYTTKAHKRTKVKYDVIVQTIAFLQGQEDYEVTCAKLSNREIFALGFPA